MRAILVMCCCVGIFESSAVSAQELRETALDPGAIHASAPPVGGLRRALMEVGGSRHATATLDPVRGAGGSCGGNWAERHPVWTGAIVGYAVAFGAAYAAFAQEDNDTSLLKVIGPGAPAMVFGGIGAGVGALAGWGIGRNRDDDECASSQIARSSSPMR